MEKKKISIGKRIEEVVARPFQIFFREPMLIALTIFMSVSKFIRSHIRRDTNGPVLVRLRLYLRPFRGLPYRLHNRPQL